MNIEPTAEVIDQMAEEMRNYADQLDNLARRMRAANDITYAAEAIGIATNAMNNLRLDLLVTRPLRETMNREES